jgi:hypothetical protein
MLTITFIPDFYVEIRRNFFKNRLFKERCYFFSLGIHLTGVIDYQQCNLTKLKNKMKPIQKH